MRKFWFSCLENVASPSHGGVLLLLAGGGLLRVVLDPEPLLGLVRNEKLVQLLSLKLHLVFAILKYNQAKVSTCKIYQNLSLLILLSKLYIYLYQNVELTSNIDSDPPYWLSIPPTLRSLPWLGPRRLWCCRPASRGRPWRTSWPESCPAPPWPPRPRPAVSACAPPGRGPPHRRPSAGWGPQEKMAVNNFHQPF